jgi:archaellum component FlaC
MNNYPDGITTKDINNLETEGDDKKAFELMDLLDKLNDGIKKTEDKIKDMSDYIDEAKEDLVELESIKTDALIALSDLGYSHV